jgi:hypothetical protein
LLSFSEYIFRNRSGVFQLALKLRRKNMEKTELVGLEPIQDIVELALWSAYVKNEKIVSLLIVARPGSGKTEFLKKYRKNRGVHVRRRFSACGILTDLIQGKLCLLFTKPRILGHILVYDYVCVFSYKHDTVDSTIAFLDALTEEGISRESSYWIGGDAVKDFEGLKGGVIAAINTFGFFTAKGNVKANLYKGGWLSRNIVVSYGLSQSLVSKISDSIRRGEYRRDQNFVDRIVLGFPTRRIDVKMPDELSIKIEELARNVCEEYCEDLKTDDPIGFRLHKSLISLVKASALRENRTTANGRDFERVEFLSQWMNLKMHPLKTHYSFQWVGA